MILRHGCLSNVILDKHPAKVYSVKCTPNSFQQQMISLHALHYNPVERVNRILKTMISQYMGQNHWWWNEHPPQFQFAYNTAGYRTQPIYLTCDNKLASQGSLYTEHCPALFTAASKTPSRWYELQWSELFRSRKPTATCADAIGDRELETRCKNGNIPFSIKLQSLTRNSRYIDLLEIRRIISSVIVDLPDAHGCWYRHIHVQNIKKCAIDRPWRAMSRIQTAAHSDAARSDWWRGNRPSHGVKNHTPAKRGAGVMWRYVPF